MAFLAGGECAEWRSRELQPEQQLQCKLMLILLHQLKLLVLLLTTHVQYALTTLVKLSFRAVGTFVPAANAREV